MLSVKLYILCAETYEREPQEGVLQGLVGRSQCRSSGEPESTSTNELLGVRGVPAWILSFFSWGGKQAGGEGMSHSRAQGSLNSKAIVTNHRSSPGTQCGVLFFSVRGSSSHAGEP